MNHIRKPYDISKPAKIPNMTQKEFLTERVSKLIGQATIRDKIVADQVKKKKQYMHVDAMHAQRQERGPTTINATALNSPFELNANFNHPLSTERINPFNQDMGFFDPMVGQIQLQGQ